ncbi:hypothetical protein ASE36_08885 [Rhizobium sp. Root274]|uniref:hypothetical protein n=1 Tax=unclassified Rhizobium TaxID=2613769 RepID=UPI000715176A|nr:MULTISPECIES: hypothetical protein [unclassified Rhizobium]KQW28609.1 hypothetical protein ASC71_08895 [Rhizobium sp. Root1240]KRD28810.1 hypothetical protein ASE36_08885 [Rhizobium sp. Root274]
MGQSSWSWTRGEEDGGTAWRETPAATMTIGIVLPVKLLAATGRNPKAPAGRVTIQLNRQTR